MLIVNITKGLKGYWSKSLILLEENNCEKGVYHCFSYECLTYKCLNCGLSSFVKMGVVIKASGLRIQHFRCMVCGRTFTELEGTPLEGFHDIRFALVVAYLYLCL